MPPYGETFWSSSPNTRRPSSHSRSANTNLEDPNMDEHQGFVDDDPTMSLVSLEQRRPNIFTGKFMFLVVVMLAAVGIFTGIGIALGADDVNFPLHNHPTPLDIPPVPHDLESTCAPLSIESDEGYNACLELCQPAQCCEYLASADLSCVEEHRTECQSYRASCQHLDHKKAAADEMTVDQACSTTSLMTLTGVEACNSKCGNYICCFDGSVDCPVTEAICADNGACHLATMVGKDGFVSFNEAADTVDDACSDLTSYDGQTKCTNVCNPAVCCFLTPTAWNKPCQVTCDHYEACSQLYGPIQRGETITETKLEATQSIPHQVENACNPAQLNQVDGIRECFDHCQHHICCFEEGDNSCLDTNADECPLYSACASLHYVQDSSETPSEKCAPSYVESNGPQGCMQACAKNYCCLIDERYERSCAKEDVCTGYAQACDILAPVAEEKNEQDDLIAQVHKVCTISNLKSDLGVSECEKLCSKRSCCTELGAGNCKAAEHDYCHEVISCEFLYEVVEQQKAEEEEARTDDDKGDNSVVTQMIATICNPDNLATLNGYHNCYDQCYYHLCCFMDDAALSCPNQADECAEYAPCAVLIETSNAGSGALADACSASSVETSDGIKDCSGQCAEHLCCFQEPNLPSSCVGWYGQRECDQYNSCSVLVSDSSHTVYNEEDPYLVALVGNYCSPQNLKREEGPAQCMQQCENRGCCFIKGDCYDTNTEWCNEIFDCTNHPDINVPAGTAPPDHNSNGGGNIDSPEGGGTEGDQADDEGDSGNADSDTTTANKDSDEPEMFTGDAPTSGGGGGGNSDEPELFDGDAPTGNPANDKPELFGGVGPTSPNGGGGSSGSQRGQDDLELFNGDAPVAPQPNNTPKEDDLEFFNDNGRRLGSRAR